MTLDAPVLRSRPPTGKVAPPLLLVEGDEGAGKTWAAILLTASPKVGPSFVLDLGEGSADEYGAIPGARYEVLEHDGTYAAVLEQVYAVKALAKTARTAGEPPVVLIVDTMSNEWDGLKDWVSARAKAKPANQRKLAEDPAADVDVSRNLWNDAGNRHRKLMTALMTFPGIVVMTARGKEVSATDPATGQPFRDGRKTYRIEGEKNLGHDATLVLRMTRTGPPIITKARSVHAGVKPGTDEPVTLDGRRTPPTDNVLEWLVFDVLKYDPDVAARQVIGLTGGELSEDERADESALEEKAATTPPATRPRTAPPQDDAGRPPGVTGPRPAHGWAAQEPATVPVAPVARKPEPTPQEPAQRTDGEAIDAAHELARRALVEVDVDKLKAAYGWAAGRGLAGINVLVALGDDDLAVLDLADVDGIALGALLQRVGSYVNRHGNAVRDLGIPDGPVEEPPAEDPWAQDPAMAGTP